VAAGMGALCRVAPPSEPLTASSQRGPVRMRVTATAMVSVDSPVVRALGHGSLHESRPGDIPTSV